MSNTAPGVHNTLLHDITPGDWSATPITTDGHNYNAINIAAEITDFNPTIGLFMEIWSASTLLATPDTNLGRMTFVSGTNGLKTYSSSLTLMANTSYFIVLGVDNAGGQWRSVINDPSDPNTFDVDSGSWTLETVLSNGDSVVQSYSSTNLGQSWSSDGISGAPLLMNINATLVPLHEGKRLHRPDRPGPR